MSIPGELLGTSAGRRKRGENWLLARFQMLARKTQGEETRHFVDKTSRRVVLEKMMAWEIQMSLLHLIKEIR